MQSTIQTLFLKACEIGDLTKVKTKLKEDSNLINCVTKQGWTGLVLAVYNENVKIAKYLISNGADVNASNFKGTTVFMYAKTPILEKPTQIKFLDYLISVGANINSVDVFGKTVLDYVEEKKVSTLTNWLITKGAKSAKEL